MLTPNFSSDQSSSDPSVITFLDISLGTDSTITDRQIQVVLADGTYLVPDGTSTNYIDWPYGQTSIVVDLLKRSTAAFVTVSWLAGSTVTYTKVLPMEWDFADILFLFGLLSFQTSNPTIISDANYYSNVFIMISNVWMSETAISDMDDVFSSQSSLDKNFYMITKQSLAF